MNVLYVSASKICKKKNSKKIKEQGVYHNYGVKVLKAYIYIEFLLFVRRNTCFDCYKIV